MKAYGLQTHIWANNYRSALLLLGFPILLLVVFYALLLLVAGFGELEQPFVWAAQGVAQGWPFAILGAIIWFCIAYLFHQRILDSAIGARGLTRKEEPGLYNLLENLCISRGITMPALRVIETPALNAYASGLEEKHYSITLTRGLIQTLDKEEIEAVLAHELTHIRNRDVRLLVVAVIFVGVFSFIAELVFRGLPRSSSGGGSGSKKNGGGGGAAILVALALIALAYGLAIVLRFALSRRREYLADAGAVELTKNPDAMISALRKISGQSDIARAPAEMREMFIDNPRAVGPDLFATHPSIEKRIAALQAYAGGRA